MNLLTHYTDVNGLVGIIKGGCMWAAHFTHLSDEQELRYAGQYLKEQFNVRANCSKGRYEYAPADNLEKLIAQAANAEKCKKYSERIDFLSNMIFGIESVRPQDKERGWFDPYIASLCGHRDSVNSLGLLSQWRAYGKDSGYALQFDRQKLEALIKLEDKMWQGDCAPLQEVHYIESSDSLPSEMSKCLADIDSFAETGDDSNLPSACAGFIKLAIGLKNPGFKEEEEVRMCFFRPIESDDEIKKPPKPVRFRVRHGVPEAYIELFNSEECKKEFLGSIVRVMVGPHRDKLERASFVRRFLKENQCNAEVIVSSIPYR